jgi:hypothetical protein
LLRRLRIENLVLIREAELDLAPGLNAITGETGAGKTILSQAVGLLLGGKGDAAAVGADGDEAYVEAELDLPEGLLDEEGMEALADLRPEDEDSLVLARRIFGDGRTRAYAWGRAIAREDVAAAAERLIAMSGQFEQRRLARPSYQLDVLDAFVGDDQLRRRRELRRAWRDLLAARRRHDELAAGAADAQARLEELRALVEDTAGLDAADEDSLRSERERLRHVTELAAGAGAAVEALSPDEGEGATGLAGAAARSLAPLEAIAPELAAAAAPPLRGDVDLRGRTTLRQLVRLVYHAQGVISPISLLMHLAAAVETKPGLPKNRPCVVVAGGREPPAWFSYPHHQVLHRVGALSCCADGGCWKARVVPLGDGDKKDRADNLCAQPVGTLPRCMDMISTQDVVRAVEGYFEGGAIEYLRPQEDRRRTWQEMTSVN